jgi:hypothetical protein
MVYTLLAIAGVWLLVSYRLFAIHRQGVEVYFTMKYKSYQVRNIKESRRVFNTYFLTLWLIEVISGLATAVLLAITINGF